MKNRIDLGNFKGWELYFDSDYYYAKNGEDHRVINHNQIVFGDICNIFSELKNRIKEYRKQEREKEKDNKFKSE
jgi:hypothetical protein